MSPPTSPSGASGRARPGALSLVTPAAAGGACSEQVTLHGSPGTVISKAVIQFVFWGGYWSSTGTGEVTSYDQAWQDVGNNPAFYGRLAEYSTSEQAIVTGSWIGSTLANASLSSGTTVTEAQIQNELDAELLAGTIAPLVTGRIWVVFLPPGVTSQFDAANGFAGHHREFVDASGNTLNYAVITYNQDVNYNDPLVSHELSESITDPDLSTGWYDSNGEEIGDLCRFTYATLDGFTIETIYSNKACGCVGASTTTDAGPPDTGTDAGIDSGTTNSCNPTVASYQQARCNQTAVYNGNLYECISQAVNVDGETTGCGATGVYCNVVPPTDPAWGTTAWKLVQSCSTTCTPTTCDAQNATCGSIPDGCGGTLSCGTCPSGQTCSSSNACQTSTGSCNPTVSAYWDATCNSTAVFNGGLYQCISQAAGVNGEPNGCGSTGVYCSVIPPTDPAWGTTAWTFLQTCP